MPAESENPRNSSGFAAQTARKETGSATVAALQASGAKRVAFVITGTVHYGSADEDLACAEWMVGLLRGNRPPVEPYLDRVRESVAAATFLDPASPLYAPADVGFCARADVFCFPLKVRTGAESLVLRAR